MKRTPFTLYIFDDYFCITKEKEDNCLVLARNDLNKLEIGVERTQDVPLNAGRFLPFYAVFGVYTLLKGDYLAIITEAKAHARLNNDAEVYSVLNVELLLIPANVRLGSGVELSAGFMADEAKYLSMIKSAMKESYLYFSYKYELSHSLQRMAELEEKNPSWADMAQRADSRFCWNYPACEKLIKLELFEFMTPVIQGHVQVLTQCTVGNKVFDLVYISRRGRERPGTRFSMRGIDDAGKVANFVETEQVCVYEDKSKTSIVQIRGSIPVYWSSPVTLKYAPKVYQRKDKGKDLTACKNHLDECVQNYGRVLLVNLIDKKTEQLSLGTTFQTTIADLVASDRNYLANVRFVWFDFHHECRKMQWHNLEKLVHQVDADFQDYGYFSCNAKGQVLSKQTGVVRTNCMDNLDRTNVVQSLFGRRSLLLQTGQKGCLKGSILSSPFEEFEKDFKNIWGNNADTISFLYAGTGALKTDFTRTGKRTKKGILQDGYNSCLRYILNNFYDGYRQDKMDLLLKNYVPSTSQPSPFTQNIKLTQSKFLQFSSILLVFFTLAQATFSCKFQTCRIESIFSWMVLSVITFSTISFVMLSLALKKGYSFIGQRFVNLPLFLPQAGCLRNWD